MDPGDRKSFGIYNWLVVLVGPKDAYRTAFNLYGNFHRNEGVGSKLVPNCSIDINDDGVSIGCI